MLAPQAARAGLFALFGLDLELAQVVQSTTEPLLGEIRLAWWREQLDRLDTAKAPAQPTLADLAHYVLPTGVTGASLEPLEDAFLALLLDQHFDDAALHRYLTLRGGRLFAAAAIVLGGDPAVAHDMGMVWALADLVRRGTPPVATAVAMALLRGLTDSIVAFGPQPALRPLLGLMRLAQRDLRQWQHQRPLPPRGTAGRQLRLQWTLLTGR